MASFVEDTDEDFFDKLVNDDDDNYKPTALSESNVVDVKGFGNLSISDLRAGVEDLDKSATIAGIEPHDLVSSNSVTLNSVSEESVDDTFKLEEPVDFAESENPSHGIGGVKDESGNAGSIEPNRLVSSNSVTLSSVSEEPDNGGIRLEEPMNFAESESQNHGVKEVQWSNFGSGSLENNFDAFGSDPDFFNELGDGSFDQIGKEDGFINGESNSVVDNSSQVKNVNDYSQQVEFNHTGSTNVNSSQYWENLYPGWRYDANTGQWYQVDESYNEASYVHGANNTDSASDWTALSQKSDVSYLQQSIQSVVGSVTETGKTESVTNWNSVSQSSHDNESSSNWNPGSQDVNTVYPSHMVFDPQYPGWYYDMNTQNWCSLDDYKSQSAGVAQDLVNQNGFGQTNTYYKDDQKTYSGQEQDYNWNGSFSNAQQGSTTWQPKVVDNSAPIEDFRNNQQVANHVGQQQSYDYARTTANVNNGFPGSQSFVPHSQPFGQPLEQSETMNVQKAYGNENQLSYLQQPVQSGHQISYASSAGRSSAGRPPHALVTFGFGGKLIVMKDSTDLANASYGGQDTNSGSISVLSLAEVVTRGAGVHDYFQTLCRYPFPGPLSGGNVGGKELNRWIDDRITRLETSDVVDHNKGEVLRLLLSLLKIASQHYGKLRSPFGSDANLKENDAPEVAVARLFASVKSSAEYNNYGAFPQCLQQVPSEGQTRETAAEVQTLLVSGRKKEALLRAQEGQLWGPALVLAAQLGDQFYVDTAKKMALAQLVPGSPLRTLCLLIAGQPADVFAADATTDGGIHDAVNISRQPTQAQSSGNSMLDDWKDNLAVITANRTKDDELVLIHLGDCLWKERSDIIAAHICYLVAEANFEPYSDSSRLCLIGADHWNNPRTYASPEAIQRTEVYEYSKLLGNSQFTLLPFQPYKLIYAHMLAEVGRVTDSLKYCQAITKSLKTGRIPEVETWRQLVTSLEDRIKIHQQGGFSTNLAPGKIVGKLLNLFDSTAHRVVGGTPPPAPSTFGGSAQNDHHQQPQKGLRFLTSQSTMAMSSLLTSPSMEQINQGDGNRRMLHTRSASEPDFGRSSKQDQDDTLRENSTDSQRKASGNTSRFGRFAFGSGILQKTVSMVLKPRQDKQAKLGDTNKFYYDEKLKRWVEEGVDSPAEEAALPPPPTFQNGSPDYSLKTALRTDSMSNGSSQFANPTPPSHTSGVPPIPATTNHFSARGRTGVRARYVDTFNQGGGNPTNLFQSPSVPTIKPKTSSNPNPNFFVPTAAPAPEQPAADIAPDNLEQHTSGNQPPFTSRTNQSATGMQKFPSMNDMSNEGSLSTSTSTSTSSFAYDPISRRTSSWSGGLNQNLSVSGYNSEQKAVGGMPRHTFMPNHTGFTHSSNDDLLEVEL
ncbi:putative COPII coat assembly protein, Sec16 [Helianthus annuus]|uniref:Protein transport protein sec16 n=1 Tax=Helianthus annuus TaxID=4232 RepID=A0A251U671_HELAN|nr:protein transport protein SEC16B homolog isoform X1 [Helianthus annuus]KAF5795796.1 putative COPII coat assembly protein, Sec16 [Helianthus annuus]KAJ0553909.1 putative COPII coat assembly protein, Sec16 [Helianthus annuus]KAJ0719552.1 putative COPII coat assembly protein, Sec16 [Helianthus annuus]KAJ0722786.1 putative COPII coat assembly protein, Sec16 [Helianthus annuus]KAJ0898311.1 putative COPII coat assembly protein, Sec16 [Helianthus annuus]